MKNMPSYGSTDTSLFPPSDSLNTMAPIIIPGRRDPTRIKFQFNKFDDDENKADCLLYLPQSSYEDICSRLNVNGEALDDIYFVKHEGEFIVFQAMVPMQPNKVFGTFPNTIVEYTMEFEVLTIDTPEVIHLPVLSCTETDGIENSVVINADFMKSFEKGSVVLSCQEETYNEMTYEPKLKLRVLKRLPCLERAIKFYAPVCSMVIALILCEFALVDMENFSTAILAVVSTLVFAFKDLIDGDDLGETLLFGSTIVLFYFSLIRYGSQTVRMLFPLFSLVVALTSELALIRWMNYVCSPRHDVVLQWALENQIIRPSNVLKSFRQALADRAMLVKNEHILNIDDGEFSDYFPAGFGCNRTVVGSSSNSSKVSKECSTLLQ